MYWFTWKKCFQRKFIFCIILILYITIIFQLYLKKVIVTNKQSASDIQVLDLNDSIIFDVKESKCDIIHLAIVCDGSAASHQVVTLIKSLLFYRRNPIHMHFLIHKKSSETVLSYLFQTWNIPDFTVSFYSVDNHLEKIEWIPNAHYSGIYGLLKVISLDILPVHLQKVIVLDTDLVFNADVAQLWAQFKVFNYTQAIGLVENQSNWYLGTLSRKYTPWPALGRGFNTGVMLLDCMKLRKIGWNVTWENVTKQIIKKLHKTALADQDIINSVINEYPFLVYNLPCKWNIQLSDNMKRQFCSSWITKDFGIFHGNKHNKKLAYVNMKYPLAVYEMFANMNGDLVKLPAGPCISSYESNVVTSKVVKDQCDMIFENGFLLRRVHLFYFPFLYNNDTKRDVSIVVQLNLDRFLMFEKLCLLWKGPVSVAIFVSDAELNQVKSFIANSKILNSRTNIAYHVVFKNYHETIYPINLLRNIALKNAITEYVFLYDVDFSPMPHLYEYISSVLFSFPGFNRTAFIVPAFESLLYHLNMPETKSDLIKDIKKGIIIPFKSKVWPIGHLATNYPAWMKASQPYLVNWTEEFEPYVVLKKIDCPSYDKRFSGFGLNKVSHIMELDASGHKFVVLPFGYILHYPHKFSADSLNFHKSSLIRNCIRKLKALFVDRLLSTYGKNYGD